MIFNASAGMVDILEDMENGINDNVLSYIIILLLGVIVLCSILNYRK